MANTIVEYMHEHGGYRCGYCGGSNSNYSHGMWAHSLSSQDYQDLLDRGWRRSGCYLYKPLMDKMCCPCYTIRCNALEFKPSKSQKKVIKKMTRFLSKEERPSCNPKSVEDTEKDEDGDTCLGTSEHPAQEREVRKKMTEAAGIIRTDLTNVKPNASADVKPNTSAETSKSGQNSDSGGCGTAGDNEDEGQELIQEVNSNSTGVANEPSTRKHPTPGLGPDPSKPPCRKAREIRRQRRLERLAKSGADVLSADKKPQNEPKSLEAMTQEVEKASHGSKHKLEVKLVRSSPESRQFKETFQESHEIFVKYQTTIHKEPDDECQEEDFKRFLVDSPLQEENLPGAPECGYGSFHEHFLLDGKIIAVGVLDILPNCVSSVYFYYDPDYSFLSLGTYSALREIEFTRLLHQEAPKINRYYMGFYIHSCVKMRYKGQYHPSFLLCPEAYTWCPIEQCRPKLDVSKYSRLDETDTADTPVNLQEVRVLYRQMSMRYSDYRRFAPNTGDEEEVKEYAQFVGKTCARRILLYRH
ncbi:arginyl-tRNA--protein transferase 1-like isoform X2 [Acanthaster planci]|uniref:Arginyl-tRNA--protein transferase 1 n=1 Tax=Acanthaster planci TaxID=133434 RepID=A0A8B7YBT1_ACAPL|nr:arginyl-tRNA--protein transferase 1-like isoform X2 [Acanthaster planci]